ncbi:polyhydroxyalkanoic acid system family protein [Halobaculum magnesiiphilum]|uniref:Polyhydroxyalkanoic acid system family protein n=1 Tax=Halobaculum magnesiiphilum TaxID=1017351 RepID=A0A8T8WFC3_9EURY|nr:polyhydroxyalkanoic acid system family protein [Halobaculum magnesiiphilum]QZP38530.1 polyhydroxyalkanoic acid system family protein [Halobaculum magnesiiphilum]
MTDRSPRDRSRPTEDVDTDPDAEAVAVGDLRVAVDVEATVDGDRLAVRSVDGRIDVSADSLRTLGRLGSLREAVPDRIGQSIDRVPIGVHVGDVEVGRVDPDVPAGPLARALGVAPVRLDLGGVTAAVLRGRW